MIKYLYYKLYRASLKSSLHETAEFTATIFLGCLITINIIVISAFLAKIDVLPFLFSSKEQGALFCFTSIVLTNIYFLRKKRYKTIVKQYAQETDKKRIQGNIIVGIYVVVSFLLMFAVALFKPGKL